MKIFFVDILSKYTGEQLMAPLGILYLISYARKYYDNYQEEDFIFLDTKKYNKLKFKKIVKIIESEIKEKFNLNVLAIRRNKKYITQIGGETKIETDDMLYLFGSPGNISKIKELFWR